MIEGESMTSREELHRIIDPLAEGWAIFI